MSIKSLNPFPLSTKALTLEFLALQLAVTPSINSLTDYGAAAAKINFF